MAQNPAKRAEVRNPDMPIKVNHQNDRLVVGTWVKNNNLSSFVFTEDFKKEIDYDKSGLSTLKYASWIFIDNTEKKFSMNAVFISETKPLHHLGPYAFSLFKNDDLLSDPLKENYLNADYFFPRV